MAAGKLTGLPFRVGTTSYILPDALLPNVRWLAGRVDDVELLLFEVGDDGTGLPTAAEVEELRALGRCHGLGYTVHLPLDLELAAGDAGDPASVARARRTIEATAPLSPWAWVLHVEDGSASARSLEEPARRGAAARALADLAAAAGGGRRLAVENLGGDGAGLAALLDEAPVSRCLDVGHLWRDGVDPLPLLRADLDRVRVVHAHGVGSRDHQSLAHVPREDLAGILGVLEDGRWGGVLTVEVFGRDELESSLEALRAAAAGRAGRRRLPGQGRARGGRGAADPRRQERTGRTADARPRGARGDG